MDNTRMKRGMLGENYRKIRHLGSGGDGSVYLVQHIPTEQIRAAKLLKAEVQGKHIRELELMKGLNHPALPKILDVIVINGQVWLIMEYISGQSLTECARSLMTPEFFYQISMQLASVIEYLHSRKRPILHLDLKPSNILIQNKKLILLDFGAAVLAGEEREDYFGTPGFAAPEQFFPNGKVSVQSDIYGFGATMYFCLFGVLPGEFETPLLPGLLWMNDACKILARCLEQRPEQRFHNFSEVYQELVHAQKWYHYRVRIAGSAAAGLFLIVTILFAFYTL